MEIQRISDILIWIRFLTGLNVFEVHMENKCKQEHLEKVE